MKIAKVTTNGVGGVPDRTFDLIDPKTKLPASTVLVVGPPGSGRTRFLECITAAKEDVGPYGSQRPKLAVRADSPAAKVQVQWVFDGEDQAKFDIPPEGIGSESIFGETLGVAAKHDPRLQLLLRRYDHDPDHGKMEYFPALRTLVAEVAGGMSIEEYEQKEVRMLPLFRKYGGLPKYLMELGLGLHGREKGKVFAFGFDSLCKTKSPRAVRRTTRGPEILFADPQGQEFGIPELSTTEQQAAIFAGTASMIGLNHSVVLVDDPELGQPCEGVAAFVAALLALGKNNQWIFATSNAELKKGGADVVIDLGTKAGG